MRYKLTFVAGLATGYVLGTKAGRKRYDTITDGVRRLIDSPAVQETAGVLQAQASGAFASARSTVTAKVSDKVSARFAGGHRDDHLFGETREPDSPPPYPAAGHQEFGGDT
jgi:hypothetical protein